MNWHFGRFGGREARLLHLPELAMIGATYVHIQVLLSELCQFITTQIPAYPIF